MGKRFFAGLVVVLVAILAVIFMRHFEHNPVGGMKTDKNKTKGSPFAKVQIIEYSDFQCPACKRAQPVLEELIKKYPNKVQVAFRHFPLAGHRWAKISHQSAECAARQGKFWPYHDRLYAEQEAWSFLDDPAPTFLKFAQETGLNMEQFSACLTDEKVTRAVNTEKEEGDFRQVRSTPSFFINNKRFVGHQELAIAGEAFIRSELGLSSEK